MLGQFHRAEDAALARALHEGVPAPAAAAVLDTPTARAYRVDARPGPVLYTERGGWVVEARGLEGDDDRALAALAAGAPLPPRPSPGTTIDWPGATPRDLELAHGLVEATRSALASLLPAAAPPPDAPVRVIVAPVAASAAASAPATGVGAGYRMDLRAVRVGLPHLSRLTLVHETTHALLHARLGVPPPPWLDEGLAQVVAARVERGDAFRAPAGRPVSDLAALAALDGPAFTRAGAAAYAESARWVAWLLPDGPAPAPARAAFARYLAALDAAEPARRAAAAAELRGL